MSLFLKEHIEILGLKSQNIYNEFSDGSGKERKKGEKEKQEKREMKRYIYGERGESWYAAFDESW